MTPRKRTALLIGVGAIVVVAGLAVLMEAFDVLGGEYRIDVDVNSGRVRGQRFVFGVCVRETVAETEFSKLVRRFSLADESAPAKWRPSNAHGSGALNFFGKSWATGWYSGAVMSCEELAREVARQERWEDGGRAVVAEFFDLLKMGDSDPDRMDWTMRRRMYQIQVGEDPDWDEPDWDGASGTARSKALKDGEQP